MHTQSRRDFIQRLIGASAAGALLPTLGACASVTGDATNPIESVSVGGGGSARLTNRPTTPTLSIATGSYLMNPTAANDAVLVLPTSHTANDALPFVLALHGAGGTAGDQADLFTPYANSRGFAVLAVGSRGLTWDAITFQYRYDVAFIDQALRWAFDRVRVDPARVIISGFSDGASYALGLALANGDFFTRAIAFSPGYVARSDSPAMGKPRFFDSHGRQDAVLPIDGASRRIVPALQRAGYDVTYDEFDGGHQITPSVLAAAVDFITA